MSRYVGKPFLRLLDSYVLDAIGELDDHTAAALIAAEPMLFQTFGSAASWREVVTRQMEFPEELADKINQIWQEGNVRAVAAGIVPDPLEFTHVFVDTNFPFVHD